MQEMGSSIKGSRNPMTQTSTPKSMEEVVVDVMQVDKELFQTMAIVNLNMGNLNLEVNNLKNIWPHRRRKRKYYIWNWTRRGFPK